jgi:hypothetical protein
VNLRRPPRRLTACLVAVLVLFAQTAAIAYACGIDAKLVATTTTAPCPGHLDDGADAPADRSGNLCKIHCETPTVPDAYTSVLAAPAPVVQAYVVVRPPLALAFEARRPEPRGAAPPPIVTTFRLLI